MDDQEATFRRKGPAEFKGYVANLTQTCEPENPVQLITKVQVAPNNVDDADLLIQAVPDLKERTGLATLYADGAYGSPAADEQLIEHNIELLQTGIRGGSPVADKLSLSQFDFTTNEKGKPLNITCPNGQAVPVEPGRTTGYIARFDPQLCQTCPFTLQNRCRATPGKRDPSFKLSFTQREVNWAKRRKRFLEHPPFWKEPQSGHRGRCSIRQASFPGRKTTRPRTVSSNLYGGRFGRNVQYPQYLALPAAKNQRKRSSEFKLGKFIYSVCPIFSALFV
jgi:hypothetical protein